MEGILCRLVTQNPFSMPLFLDFFLRKAKKAQYSMFSFTYSQRASENPVPANET